MSIHIGKILETLTSKYLGISHYLVGGNFGLIVARKVVLYDKRRSQLCCKYLPMSHIFLAQTG